MVTVSIIMSVYNETKKELKDSINSILKQSFKDFEFIIINDNPQNNDLIETLTIFKNLDPRIIINTNEKNVGLATSLNRGVLLAKGDYIARMDADDISRSDRILKEVNYLKTNPDVDMVSTNCVYINEDGDISGEKSDIPTNPSQIAKLLPIGSSIIHPSVMVRRQVFSDLKGYRLFPTAEDYDLWLRILSSGYRIGSINEPLIKYRLRANSMTQSKKMLVFLVSQYERSLFNKRRKNNGKDDFSADKLALFLTNYGYYDKRRQHYESSAAHFDKAINLLKSQNYLKGFIGVLVSMLKSKEFCKYIWLFFSYEYHVYSMRKRGSTDGIHN